MSEETLKFQAEVSRLLHIVANALYSNREIFLRELISNASDACDRLRYQALTEPALMEGGGELTVELTPDTDAGTLSVADTGIGMSRDELVENLGTIARSGTAAFVEALEAKPDDMSLIGQFGVGFYSAFMVAEEVSVFSRRAGGQEGFRWHSDGAGTFSVEPSEEAPARGTRIVLKLKEDAREFLETARLRRIVSTYSDHVPIPVVLVEGETRETLNKASALWRRPKSEVTAEQYTEFYRSVSHGLDEPWATLHFKAEGILEYAGLLFIPSQRPFDLFHPERKSQLRLYVKRVFITDSCEDLVPGWLRFLRGVIDSEDLPLNVSRELLQHNPALTRISKAVVKRVLDELENRAKADEADYVTFWDAFGAVFKEGLYESEGDRERLLELCRFRSTAVEGWTSLAGYLERMKEGQEAIYTLTGDPKSAARSPQLEGFRAKGVEVLLLTDPVDDFWLSAVPEYQGKPFKSVTRGGVDLGAIKDKEGEAEAEAETPEAERGIEPLIAAVKLALEGEVSDVRASERLTESPVCLVAEEGGMDLHLERLLKAHQQLEHAGPRILELNPKHELIQGLARRIGESGSGQDIEEAAKLLLDQARILEGEPLPDPIAYSRRVSSFLARGMAAG